MYNKLFTKILDSSIWLAPDPHRLVWITLIAAMNGEGVAEFACAENLAARARVSVEDTVNAVKAFEAPDPYDLEQEFEGRRIERVPGGWLVLNAEKYRGMVTRAIANERSKERMRRWREAKRGEGVTRSLRSVTPSVSVSEAISKAEETPHTQVGGAGGKARKLAPVRKRCPEDFEVTEEMKAWVRQECPDVDWEQQTGSFRDYEFRNGKTDWVATWRNWMRKAHGPAQLKSKLTWRPDPADDANNPR